MRAALPHLKLLTLKADQLSQLGKFLTSEEKSYLGVRMTFSEENCCGPAPPSLNTNKTPRMEPIKEENASRTVELIPEDLITKSYSEVKTTSNIRQASKFSCGMDLSEDCRLKGVEILTRFKRFEEAHSPKKARYFKI